MYLWFYNAVRCQSEWSSSASLYPPPTSSSSHFIISSSFPRRSLLPLFSVPSPQHRRPFRSAFMFLFLFFSFFFKSETPNSLSPENVLINRQCRLLHFLLLLLLLRLLLGHCRRSSTRIGFSVINGVAIYGK